MKAQLFALLFYSISFPSLEAQTDYFLTEFDLYNSKKYTQENQNPQELDSESSVLILKESKFSKSKQSSTDSTKVFSLISLYYTSGSGLINNNNTRYKSLHNFGFDAGLLYPISNHVSLGLQLGASLDYSYFNKVDTVFYPENFVSEKYINANYKFSVLTRLSAYNQKINLNKGLFLDLGLSYNLPRWFRYVYRTSQTKNKVKKIHQFKDLSARVSLGYNCFSIKMNYRLLDYIKGGYPEIPKFKIGIGINFLN